MVETIHFLSAQDMERLEHAGDGNGIQALLDALVQQQAMLRDRTHLDGGRGYLRALSLRRALEGPEIVDRLVEFGARVLSGDIVAGQPLSTQHKRALLIEDTSAVLQLYDHLSADESRLLGPAIQDAIAQIPERPERYPYLTPDKAQKVRDRFTRLTTPPAPHP